MPVAIAAAVTAGVAAVKELDSLVGIVLKHAKRLVQDKAGAGVRLSQALGQIRASCEALDKAVTAYVVVGVSDAAAIQNAATLFDLQGGRLAAQVEQGVGGCHRIQEIYAEDLDRWFSRVFPPGSSEYQELRGAFERMFQADMYMFYDMREVARQLQASADEVVTMILAGQIGPAQDRIRAETPELQSLRKSINDVLTKIEKINTQLITAGIG